MPKRVRDEILEPSSDTVLYDKVRAFQSQISNWKRASPRVLEQLRTFILDHRDQLGALAKAAEDVISARKQDIIPGRANTFALTAPAGLYEGTDAEFAGPDYDLPDFRVRVVPRPEFENWLATQTATSS